MDTINTVNFEDLFDFSPEPPAPGHGGVEAEPREKLRTTTTTSTGGHQLTTGAANTTADRDAFADFEEVLTGGHQERRTGQLHQLSASVPTHWRTTSSDLYSRDQLIRASKDSLSSSGTEFTVGSVDQLLKSLPAGVPESSSLASTGATNTTTSAQQESSSVPVVVKSKRGRKPGQKSLRTDMKTKLERSRQSARECRARKKLRYQYLDDLILEREKANEQLREELLKYQKWCHELDNGRIPDGLQDMLREFKNEQQQQ